MRGLRSAAAAALLVGAASCTDPSVCGGGKAVVQSLTGPMASLVPDPAGGPSFDPRLANSTWSEASGGAAFDAGGRVARRWDALGSERVEWVEDCPVQGTVDGYGDEAWTAKCDDQGQLVEWSTALGTFTYENEYDDRGRLLVATSDVDGGEQDVFEWSGDHLIAYTQTRDDDAEHWTWRWDGDRLDASGYEGEGEAVATQWFYDGDRVRTSYATWGDGHTVETMYTYRAPAAVFPAAQSVDNGLTWTDRGDLTCNCEDETCQTP